MATTAAPHHHLGLYRAAACRMSSRMTPAVATAAAAATRRTHQHLPGVERRCIGMISAPPVLSAATTSAPPFATSSVHLQHEGGAPGCWSPSGSPFFASSRGGGNVRSFRSAPVVAAPTALRRRPRHPRTKHSSRGEDDEGGDAAAHTSSAGLSLAPVPVTDPTIFERAATQLLDKIESALRPLEPLNQPNFALVRSSRGNTDGLEGPVSVPARNDDDDDDDDDGTNERLHLDLGPVHGFYELRVNASEQHVRLFSPISGQHLYVLSEGTGTFCSHDDGHSLEGMLVRDLIRQIYGVPQL